MANITDEILYLPLRTFGIGVELMVRSARELTALAQRGLDAFLGGRPCLDGAVARAVSTSTADWSRGSPGGRSTVDPPLGDPRSSEPTTSHDADGGVSTPSKEERPMSDQSLAGDDIRVVEYSILNIRPDSERVYPGFPRTKVVTDKMTGEDFVTWVVAEYIQEDPRRVDHADKKYLRVCYRVICRFAKEDSNYPKEEVDVLRQIRDVLAVDKGSPDYLQDDGAGRLHPRLDLAEEVEGPVEKGQPAASRRSSGSSSNRK